MKCPDENILQDFVIRELPDEHMDRIRDHLKVCASCSKVVEQQRVFEEIFSRQDILQAPPGFRTEILERLQTRGLLGMLPEWLMALGLGLIVIFLGLMTGKYADPVLLTISNKIKSISFNPESIPYIGTIAEAIPVDRYMQISGGNNMMVLNVLIAGVILCWGLWQMVKALRR